MANIALGQLSVASRGVQTGYTASCLTGTQNSVGELALGTALGNRQITGVAAASQGTDAVNLNQLDTSKYPICCRRGYDLGEPISVQRVTFPCHGVLR